MIIIRVSQRMECVNCKSMNSFPINVDSAMVPVEITCPRCANSFRILNKEETRYTRLGKVPPQVKSDGIWRISPVQEDAESVAKQDSGKTPEQIVQEEVDSTPEELREQSFFSKIKDAHATGISFMYQMQEVRAKIQELCDHFESEMMRPDLHRVRGIDSWNPKLLYHFITHPFSKIDANCLDDLIDPYSGFLLCPKFYPKLHGFPIGCKGGYYVQAITPYSQMAFPLESHLVQSLDIKEALSLRVLGDKIIGPSLPQVWRNIPGIKPDVDHTPNNPSVVIADAFESRRWLAKNGVFGYAPLEGMADEFFPFHEPMIEEDCNIEAIRNFHREFMSKGRAVLCWQNHALARMAASITGHGMRGVKVIFSDSDEQYDWHKGFRTEYMDKRMFAHHTQGDRLKFLDMDQVSLVIVDAVYSMPDPDFLVWLHQYKKSLVIILRDGLLDTFEENEYASAIFSLANMVSVIPDDAHWRNAWKSFESKPPASIQRTLMAMRLSD